MSKALPYPLDRSESARAGTAARWFGWLGVLMLAGLLAGCASYRLGPSNGTTAGQKSIQINPFVNQTVEPRLTESFMAMLRKQLQQDGTYALDSHGEADIILNGVITEYEREGVTFQPNDVITPRDINVRVSVHLTATERETGKVVFDESVSGRTPIRIGCDLPSAERYALPLLAADWAQKAKSRLVDGSW